MTRILTLYDIAEENGIAVESYGMTGFESLSVMDSDGDCFIGIDPMQLKNSDDERMKLAHELGHCLTGAFYSRYTPLVTKEICERRAYHWAIKKLVTKDELIYELENGDTQIWDLAEHFGVSGEMIRDAIIYYGRKHEQRKRQTYNFYSVRIFRLFRISRALFRTDKNVHRKALDAEFLRNRLDI